MKSTILFLSLATLLPSVYSFISRNKLVERELFVNETTLHSSVTDKKASLGYGIGMYYWYNPQLVNYIGCFTAKDYESLFIYVYYDNAVEPEAIKTIQALFNVSKNAVKLELMILPSFTGNDTSNKDPEVIINEIVSALSGISLSKTFMWIDTAFMNNPNGLANVRFIEKLIGFADKQNIRADIIATKDSWTEHMLNTDEFSKKGYLLWDDLVSQFTLTNYGGWLLPSVIHKAPHASSCSIYHAEIIYDKTDLDKRTGGANGSFGIVIISLTVFLSIINKLY